MPRHVAPLANQCVAQIVERTHIIAVPQQRFPQGRLGVGELPVTEQRRAEMVVDPRIMLALCRSAFQIVNGIRQSPAIQMHNTQQMQRIEVARILRDQLTATAFHPIIVARGVIAGRGIYAVGRQWRKAVDLMHQPGTACSACSYTRFLPAGRDGAGCLGAAARFGFAGALAVRPARSSGDGGTRGDLFGVHAQLDHRGLAAIHRPLEGR